MIFFKPRKQILIQYQSNTLLIQITVRRTNSIDLEWENLEEINEGG